MSTPPSLVRLVEQLERLPGIGTRSAERLAHHLLRASPELSESLADAIREARVRIRTCSRCRAPTETEPCAICSAPERDRALVMVVETARDLVALEESGGYRGTYYVLGGRLSPLEGVRTEDLELGGLVRRCREPEVREVCIATNPDLEGDGTARAIERALADADVTVSRLARGLPSGGQIEYQSAAVLAEAFEERRRLR